jgi:hypothetical protein
MGKTKYNWSEVQKVYDEQNLTRLQCQEIFGMCKAAFDRAIKSGHFKPRPQHKVEKKTHCLECGSELVATTADQIYNIFCSHSCLAKHSNKNRDRSFYSKTKTVNCCDCNVLNIVKLTARSKLYRCDACTVKKFITTGLGKSNLKKIKNKIENGKFCILFNTPLFNTQLVYCSNKCLAKKTNFGGLGKKGGQVSKNAQNRRSKNEIYFAELCQQKFKIVKTNENLFNGWDADIILFNEKVAIHWNGIWHYEQISKKQSLKQVQTRDKFKIENVEKCGYKNYVVKDMGAYNKSFVEQQFILFCNWLDKETIIDYSI